MKLNFETYAGHLQRIADEFIDKQIRDKKALRCVQKYLDESLNCINKLTRLVLHIEHLAVVTTVLLLSVCGLARLVTWEASNLRPPRTPTTLESDVKSNVVEVSKSLGVPTEQAKSTSSTLPTDPQERSESRLIPGKDLISKSAAQSSKSFMRARSSQHPLIAASGSAQTQRASRYEIPTIPSRSTALWTPIEYRFYDGQIHKRYLAPVTVIPTLANHSAPRSQANP